METREKIRIILNKYPSATDSTLARVCKVSRERARQIRAGDSSLSKSPQSHRYHNSLKRWGKVEIGVPGGETVETRNLLLMGGHS